MRFRRRFRKYNTDREDNEEQMRPGTRILLVEDDRSIVGSTKPMMERGGAGHTVKGA
jgi:hypothetical protein